MVSCLCCSSAISSAFVSSPLSCTLAPTLSPSLSFPSAPCVPAYAYASVVCVSNTVRASWGQAVGALSYTGVLTGLNGFTRSCSTSAFSCDFTGLTCAQTYTLRVFASNSCNSTATTDVTVTTGV